MDEADTKGPLPGAGEDCLEFRLITAYVEKRRDMCWISSATALTGDTPQPAQDSSRNRKKSSLSSPGRFRRSLCGDPLVTVTKKLTRIVDSVHLESEDIETDGPDDVVQAIVELLRESGDRLNEEMKTNKSLAELFRSAFTYSLFKEVTGLFLQSVDPSDVPDSTALEQTQVALTFEVTSRLTAVDCHPMNVAKGFGAKYLQENYSAWVKQHGGWNAFDTKDDEEVQ